MTSLEELVSVHEDQLGRMGLPEELWGRALGKILREDYDASSILSISLVLKDDEDETCVYQVNASSDVEPKEDVYLIDNWFTFSLRRLPRMLEGDVCLLERVEQLIGLAPMHQPSPSPQDQSHQPEESNGHSVKVESKSTESRITNIMKHMWPYVGTYSLGATSADRDESLEDDDESLEPVWYFMDIFGTHIDWSGDAEEANVRMAPFLFGPTMASYTLLWVTQPISAGELVMREHLLASRVASSDPSWHSARMLPWEPEPSIDCSPYHVYDFGEVAAARNESLPLEERPPRFADPSKVLVILVQDPEVAAAVTSLKFRAVTPEPGDEENTLLSKENVDAFWLMRHFRQFDECVKNSKFVNQFPAEYLFTCKDLLASMASRRVSGSESQSQPQPQQSDAISWMEFPAWFQPTYNLYYELPRFIYDWLQRQSDSAEEEESEREAWIVKPWNYARGVATYISVDNLEQLVRLCETNIPLIAQKYIHNPVLYFRDDIHKHVKFDYRICICVQSLRPLRVFAHDVVWLRVANMTFSMSHFHQYARHFTVMNYRDSGKTLNNVPYDLFKQNFAAQYPQLCWDSILADSHRAIKELFEATCSRAYPASPFQCENSRALYAVDLMLKWEGSRVQPVILEVNFNPDTKRAMQFYPDFYNDVFELLFFNQYSEKQFTLL